MNKIKFFIVPFLIIIFMSSCAKPPDDVEEINIINFIKDFLDKLNELEDDPEAQLNFFKNIVNDFQAIIALYKDTEIYIKSIEAEPLKGDFMHSLDNNNFILKEDVYFTFEKKEPIFSLDNKTWYLNKADPNKKIEGVQNDYYFKTKVDNKKIFIDYSMSFRLGRAPKIVKAPKHKEIVRLKKGMVFASDKEDKVDYDLSKVILLVPKGTLLSGRVKLSGNIAKVQSDNEVIYVKSLQDIFMYIKNKFFSISLDKKNWNVNILSFNIEPVFEVKAIEDDQIFFDIKVTADYHKDKISFSIIKLLQKTM